MKVLNWDNSLAIRLPSDIVESLGLREGDRVILNVIGKRTLRLEKEPNASELLARLRKYRGRLPMDIKVDRLGNDD